MRDVECPPHTTLSAGAGVASLLLGLVLCGLFATHDLAAGHARLLLAVLAFTTLLTGARLTSVNCPEARFACSALAVLVLTGTLLATSAGLPGSAPVTVGPTQWTLLALGSVVPALLGLDVRARRAEERTYAC